MSGGRLVLLWVALLAVACTPARRKAGSDIVRNIGFHGNGGALSGHNDYQLATQMEQDESAFGLMTWPMRAFVDPKLLDRAALVRDAYRLEVWYAHRGWFDARFGGWAVDRVRGATRRKAGVVDLLGFVDPGRPSLVRKLEVSGDDGTPRILTRAVLRTSDLKPGVQFDLDVARATRERLRTELRRQGYAYADVGLKMDVRPADHAVDIELPVTAGIPARFGEVEVVGAERVKERYIRDALRIEPGSPYRLDTLLKAQNRLFGMDTFSLVTVQPDLSDPSAERVPIRVKVTENRFRSLRFGGGLRAQGVLNWEPYVSSTFKHTNVLGQLLQYRLSGRVGVSGYTPRRDASNPTPVWKFTSSLLYPRLLHQTVAQQLQIDIVRALDQSFQVYFNPVIDMRTIFKPSDVLVVTAGPHLELFEYPDLEPGSPAEEQAKVIYGQDFVQRYRVTSVDFGLTLDWRDDRISARRGSFFNLNTRLAFPLAEGDYSFGGFSGDWRLFRPIRVGSQVPMTLATRIHGRWVVPFNDAGLPYPELVFLGGASDMRGFPNRAMGPYSAFRPVATERVYYVPRGGSLGGVVSEELRYYGAFGLTYALFAEAAVLTNPGRSFDGATPDRFADQLRDGLRWATGVGVRYDSGIGPIRMDIAFRPFYPEDCGPIDDPDACDAKLPSQRRMDVIRAVAPRSRLPAVMLFLAFGEAI